MGKIGVVYKVVSFACFVSTICVSGALGAEYWQSMIAGTAFGLWALGMGIEE